MKHFISVILFSCLFLFARSQWSGQISDSKSNELLAGASITLYSNGKTSGLVANKEEMFSIAKEKLYDSIRISMIGYHSKIIYSQYFLLNDQLKIKLELAPAELGEVIVKRVSALDIIHKTIVAIPSFQPTDNFENTGFYREIIKDIDQKPGVKEALEKGRLLIDANDYSLLRYDAENSPLGNPYIKDLTGTDKIFAEILKIDFKRKGWKRRVDFTPLNNKWIMSYAEADYAIGYKQPKKNIDLDLTINIEFLFSDLNKPVTKEIRKDEEWQRKNIIANLPIAFDPAFWGDNSIISPTEEVKNIIEKISERNNDRPMETSMEGWQYLNRNLFVSYQRRDTITLIPVMRSLWEDDETGGMLFREMDGDFVVESRISLVKNSDKNDMPDRGFQQGVYC